MIDELKRFLLVAKSGNLTKTSREVFITQSALSQSISRLEKELGTKLLIQKGRNMNLTSDGEAIFLIAEKIIELWENAKNKNLSRSKLPFFSIGAFDNAALKLGSFFQRYSDSEKYKLDLIIDNSSEIMSKLKLGVIDLGVCVLDNKMTTDKELILLKTFREELIPVSSTNFKNNLDKIPFILYATGSKTRAQIDLNFIKKHINPNIIAQSTSVTFMKELAILGTGVTLLPKNYIRSELKQKILRVQKTPVKWIREYGLLIRKNGALTKNHAIISQIIKTLNKK